MFNPADESIHLSNHPEIIPTPHHFLLTGIAGRTENEKAEDIRQGHHARNVFLLICDYHAMNL